MIYVVYASSAVKPFSQVELFALLDTCHRNNTALGITGMMLYKDGNFIQLLEGEEVAVRGLYEKIAADPRHRGIVMFLEGVEEERQFPEWSMGFKNLEAADAADHPGYNELLNSRFTGEEFLANPTRAQKLLLLFKRSM